MKSTKNTKAITEAWEIYMGLCEEFPELYDKYVEKVNGGMKNDTPDFMLTEEEKECAFQKLQQRIKENI